MSQTESNRINRSRMVEPWSRASTRKRNESHPETSWKGLRDRKPFYHTKRQGHRKYNDALRLYRKARFRAWLGKLKSIVLSRQSLLPDLNDIKQNRQVLGWQYIGIREIPIQKIVGSEEPCHAFDSEFLPLDDQNQKRWVDIAVAKLTGIVIPPIELIQTPTGYYAQSGHNRISVLRVMGQDAIQAYVTNWDLMDQPFQQN